MKLDKLIIHLESVVNQVGDADLRNIQLTLDYIDGILYHVLDKIKEEGIEDD